MKTTNRDICDHSFLSFYLMYGPEADLWRATRLPEGNWKASKGSDESIILRVQQKHAKMSELVIENYKKAWIEY